MAATGILETLARADLEAMLDQIGRRYTPGALDALTAADPGWREALERTEREVGSLYHALREADVTLLRWRRALGELTCLWARVAEAGDRVGGVSLGEVA
jgi:hypothetical protein